jgi:hypothetical protein
VSGEAGETGDAGLSTAAVDCAVGAGSSGVDGLLTDTGLAGDAGSGEAGLLTDTGLAGETGSGLAGETGSGLFAEADDAVLVERAWSGEAGEAAPCAAAGSGLAASSAVARMISVAFPGIADELATGTSWTPGPTDSAPRPTPPATPRAPTPSARVPVMTIHFRVSFISSSCSAPAAG